VANGGHSISFHLTPGFNDPNRERWLVVRVDVGEDMVWDMLPNPTARHSSISPEALGDMQARGWTPSTTSNTALLQDLRISGQPIPDLHVRVSPAVTLIAVDGIFGFDFFEKFAAVHWEPSTGRVTLIYRPGVDA